MNHGRLVFAQLMQHLPLTTFRRCVSRYLGERKVHSFSCLDQFLCMAFAQLTARESLRDIEACLRAQRSKLYHLGIRSAVARNTLANANAVRDWRIFADFAQSLIGIARPLYVDEPFGVDLKDTVYALDATTIDLCLSVFPWAQFRKRKAAVKLHTLLDLRGSIPTTVCVTEGRTHEVNWLDQLAFETNAIYIMDRGYLDFRRLYAIAQSQAFFVIRAKQRLQYGRLHSHPVDTATGLRSDQIISLSGFYSAKAYPDKLRRVRFYDVEQQRALVFLTNHFAWAASTVAELYRCRWQIEVFFKQIKQTLQLADFLGNSANAVRWQVWTALLLYLLLRFCAWLSQWGHSFTRLFALLRSALWQKLELRSLLEVYGIAGGGGRFLGTPQQAYLAGFS